METFEWYKVSDIEAILTQEVREYLAKGYIFHDPRCLGGNEILRIDLKKGTERIRFVLEKEHTFNYEPNMDNYSLDEIIFTIGSYDARNWGATTKDLKVIKRTIFYSHNFDYNKDDGFFVTNIETAIAMYNKHHERLRAQSVSRIFSRGVCACRFADDEKAKLAVLPFIRRQDRCKTKSISDIKRIEKMPRDEREARTVNGWMTVITPPHYYITLKNNKCYRLGYKEIYVPKGA